ncbi:microtubule-associated protein 9 isoform X2 [Paramormyrops kingsleyae]|uniref:Microtubule-associated protein 9 n=1 Tax=Paramormyrops kingsleyae TaxID=1676925 RepID=A0A3B3TG72_9TELE|nr:microtubule-associated protein 9 isoform X2 [Paramormyrops kingsleyae]
MEDMSLGTMLAYTRSRKTSRRTTFQDELQAAISARAQRSTYQERYSYSDDFDDEDDIFKELLHFSKQKKSGALKLEKKKSKINDFRLSDDEDENVKPKRVSFLKTKKKTSSPPPEISEQRESPEPPVDSGPDGSHSDSIQSFHSRSSVLDSKESPTLERGQWKSPSPSPRDTGEVRPETRIVDEEDSSLQPKEPNTFKTSSTGSILEDELPKPKPRQRTLKFPTNTESESLPERPLTSSVSIPLSPTEMDSTRNGAFHNSSPQRAPREDVSVSPKFSAQTFSTEDQLDSSVHQSTPGSVSKESCALEDGEEENSQKNGRSFEEKQEDTADGSQLSASMESSVAEKARERPTSSCTARSQRTQICRPHTAQSRYLGTLKVLDHKAYTKESQAENADSLRATVYQEWLKGKDQKMKETLRVKKQEEKTLAEKKIQEALDKTGEAKASFEAWKEKKAEVTKTKMRAEREKIRRQQMETDEKEEKREEAKKVFEKWKQDQDKCLKEKQQMEKVSGSRLKQKQEEQTETRRRECTSAFSKWSEKKEEIIQEKVKLEHRQKRIKEEEEKYEKEEKSRMALEMYETWMRRKERQRRRERRQKRIDSILLEAPPPWSPPSKTVPYGK